MNHLMVSEASFQRLVPVIIKRLSVFFNYILDIIPISDLVGFINLD